MTRVSIIIPCYNAGDLLCEAVESALAQSHQDVEIIIVDDGSTDPRTHEVLQAAAWPRTKIIRKENSGPASARNVAISHSSGEYILPLDADDTIEPTYVEKALAVMESNPNVGIVYCKAMKFGAEQGPWGLPAYNLRELVIDNVIFVTSMFRRSDWLEVGGFNESLRMGVEDYEFWVKIVGKGCDVVQLDEYLFNYRIQESSRTTSFSADRSVVVDTYATIFRENVGFYAKNAEVLFEHRFGLYDELLKYRARYGRLDALLQRRPWLLRMLKPFAKLLNRFA